jgi:N-acetylglucosaminyldiphosphoundecaprenol N-acetyl-beta-D-mannosaminyltransferase
MKTFSVLGSNILNVKKEDAVNAIEKIVDSRETKYVCFANVHTTVLGRTDQHFRDITNNAVMALPDGMPLVWLGRLKKNKDLEKCSGPDVMDEILKLSAERGYTNFFYGGTGEVLHSLHDHLKNRFPNLKIVGAFPPPFRALTQAEDREIIKMINQVNPRIIWVGLGAPKQEVWMSEHVHQIKSSLLLGVGAAFNFHAQAVKRVPRWMQNIGLEWFYRLLQEPKKLWKRYLITNLLFLFYLISDNFISK